MISKIPAAAALSLALAASAASQADSEIFTGDKRLACEAILCLSSGDRPSECTDSLRRYFSISHKRLHKTIEARKNFLKLCPTSNEAGMPELVNAIGDGAGRCDAAELNRVNRAYYRTQRTVRNRHGEQHKKLVRVAYVRNAYPGYCQAYFSHGWTTAADKVRYVGEEKNGGRWVDVK